MGYLLSKESAYKLRDLFGDERRQFHYRTQNSVSRITEAILITDWNTEYHVGSAKVQALDATTGYWDDIGGEVAVVTMNGDDVVTGRRYAGWRYGLVDGVPTFAIPDVAIFFECIEVVIPPIECIDGAIVYSTKWIKVLGSADTQEECEY